MGAPIIGTHPEGVGRGTGRVGRGEGWVGMPRHPPRRPTHPNVGSGRVLRVDDFQSRARMRAVGGEIELEMGEWARAMKNSKRVALEFTPLDPESSHHRTLSLHTIGP
eukprot:scaffold5202_cov110-Isochrysis_galbana.AAC.5